MTDYPPEPIRLRVVSDPRHLAVVRAAVERISGDIGFDEECASQVGLCVHEAMANIIEHAYEGRQDRPIDVEIAPAQPDGSEGIRVVLRDYGRQVDPGEFQCAPSGPSEDGGYGMRIMRTCMDVVDYEPAGDSGTRLTMVKRLGRGKASESDG